MTDQTTPATKEDIAKLYKALKEHMEQMESRFDRRLTDIETELFAKHAINTCDYRPAPLRTTPTGGPIIEPIQAWRRKPGY
ncbi:MAG: hypothetical protein AB2728_13445 [Candidatus Thiodiazotropha sp.]|nr:hypothetical protein [Candidatus Thiodiazotropha taylori]MBT3060688.1 hypothetical protein [Candidatus Thiodiazotropha sp. (ex Lucina pensylvanica)]PUB76695.1 MAG: hypothetical protein DBP03_04490 [gamma proteobacterium symbiont of Ctena orbiculata]PUB79055.1 MAG: hypothetical protein DBO99_05175 [gamma proteobacterium symbiont of Ctena orbiculata]